MRKRRRHPQTKFEKHREGLADAIHILSHHLFYSFVLVVLVSALLSLPLTLFYTIQDVTSLVDHLNNNAEVSVYVKPNSSDGDVSRLMTTLKTRDDVEYVKYISPTTGLQQFETQTGLKELTTYLGQNPIPGVIILNPTENQRSIVKMNELAQSLGKLASVDNVVVNAAWVNHVYTILHQLNNTLIVLSLIIFILILTVTVTLFNLLLPSFEAPPSNLAMIYLATLLGLVSGLVVDTLVTNFLTRMQQLLTQFNLFDSTEASFTTSHLLSTVLCSLAMLAIAALIVRKYQLRRS